MARAAVLVILFIQADDRAMETTLLLGQKLKWRKSQIFKNRKEGEAKSLQIVDYLCKM